VFGDDEAAMPFDGTDFLQSNIRSKEAQRSGWLSAMRSPLRTFTRLGLLAGTTNRHPVEVPDAKPSEVPAVRLLRAARSLIETEEQWVQRRYASPDGTRHCAVGALRAAARGLDARTRWEAHSFLLAVAKTRGFPSAETMNDGSSHAAVIAAFDEAISMAECSFWRT
jgi:hypothetical protein